MIIDVHAHPLLFDVINENPEDLNFRKQEFGVFKSGINPVDFEMTLLADAQIDKVVLLPEDYSGCASKSWIRRPGRTSSTTAPFSRSTPPSGTWSG